MDYAKELAGRSLQFRKDFSTKTIRTSQFSNNGTTARRCNCYIELRKNLVGRYKKVAETVDECTTKIRNYRFSLFNTEGEQVISRVIDNSWRGMSRMSKPIRGLVIKTDADNEAYSVNIYRDQRCNGSKLYFYTVESTSNGLYNYIVTE